MVIKFIDERERFPKKAYVYVLLLFLIPAAGRRCVPRGILLVVVARRPLHERSTSPTSWRASYPPNIFVVTRTSWISFPSLLLGLGGLGGGSRLLVGLKDLGARRRLDGRGAADHERLVRERHLRGRPGVQRIRMRSFERQLHRFFPCQCIMVLVRPKLTI